jgi:hypothetical protein
MSHMWRLLDTYTLRPNGTERAVNQNNEWGGFSRRLRMPVFTGWFDLTTFDKEAKTTTALVCDAAWTGRPVGLPNQERWIKFAEENNESIAAFFVIHVADVHAQVRKVKYIDDDKVFIGKLVRDGGKVYLVGRPQAL